METSESQSRGIYVIDKRKLRHGDVVQTLWVKIATIVGPLDDAHTD
jgi:hypothetical protein